ATTGARPVVLETGPATAVLDVEPSAAEPAALRHALQDALGAEDDGVGAAPPPGDRAAERAARRVLVRDRCDLRTVGELAAGTARPPSERKPDRERPSILVVNASPPAPDVNSASVRLRRLLELMLDQGYDVTFVGRDGRDHARYLTELDALGIEAYATDPERLAARGRAVLAPPLDLEAILSERFHDIAWLVTWHVAEQYLPEIRRHSPLTRVVVDSEDVHFLRELRGAELSGDPTERERAEATRVREQAAYAQADALVAVSDQDAAVLSELAPGVPTAVVSNIHDPEPLGPGFDEREGLLFVGSFWHAPNVDAVLWIAHEVLPLVRTRLPDMRVRIVGAGAPQEIRALASDGIEIAGQLPDLRPDLESARVSLAPLRYGAGVKGKVGEAMAFGLPVVTTTVGAEGMGIEPGRHALVADDPRAFADAIVEAHERRERWEELRDNGRELIAARQGRGPAAHALAELDTRLRPRTTYLATPDWDDASSVRAAIEPYVTSFAPDDPVSLALCTGATDVSPGDAFAAVAAALAELGRDPASVPDMVVTALDPTRHPLPREAFALDGLEQPVPQDLPSASVRHAL
ncbi:MAG TPA: glycosyltransferase, partial [Thermoleophilaceae bacterium]